MRETKNRDAETKKEENIENEGGTDYGTDISSQGRLPVSESDRRRGRSDDREIWDAAEDISERTQEQPLSEPVPDRDVYKRQPGFFVWSEISSWQYNQTDCNGQRAERKSDRL